jgi:AcrR family transcriptional regulator
VLAVAEEISARTGVTNIKLADIAGELGIETPSIYRHYSGLKGVIAGLAAVTVRAEIDTFEGLERLPFEQAVTVQAERSFDLYVERPGLARFLMADLAVPGGIQGFENETSLELVRELFALEAELLRRGIEAGVVRDMSVISFTAARIGPAFVAIAFTDLQTPGSNIDTATLKQEFVATVMASIRKV